MFLRTKSFAGAALRYSGPRLNLPSVVMSGLRGRLGDRRNIDTVRLFGISGVGVLYYGGIGRILLLLLLATVMRLAMTTMTMNFRVRSGFLFTTLSTCSDIL